MDLAAEAKTTAVAVIEWAAATATVRQVMVGADDARVLHAVSRADKAGVDCPLGWPDAFVEFVSAHHHGAVSVPQDLVGRDWRRRLAYRETDFAAIEATGLQPLSVAADRISHTAMRAAGLLTQLAHDGHPVDRSGKGVVVEVYPAASLQQWGLPHRGYKGKKNLGSLDELVNRLRKAAGWLNLGRHEHLCRTSDHAVDAVIAAVTARAAALGLVTSPGPGQLTTARTEGWIALPTSPLSRLNEQRKLR